MTGITFVKNKMTSIAGTREELISEINHYQAFWLESCSNAGVAVYSNKQRTVHVHIEPFTRELREWLAARMK